MALGATGLLPVGVALVDEVVVLRETVEVELPEADEVEAEVEAVVVIVVELPDVDAVAEAVGLAVPVPPTIANWGE